MIDGIDDGDGDCNSWIISQLPQWRISKTLESKTHVTLHQTNNKRQKQKQAGSTALQEMKNFDRNSQWCNSCGQVQLRPLGDTRQERITRGLTERDPFQSY